MASSLGGVVSGAQMALPTSRPPRPATTGRADRCRVSISSSYWPRRVGSELPVGLEGVMNVRQTL